MGRPTNDRYFGDPDVSGSQIRATVNFDGTKKDAYIVRQRSNRKYLFRSTDEAEDETVAMLVDKAETDLLDNEAVIIVSTAGGDGGTTAVATYDTNTTTAAVENIDVTDGGSGYADGVFDVVVTDDGDGEATIRFTVESNSVTEGVVLSDNGNFDADQTGVSITMPAPEGFSGTENVRIINNRVVKTFSNNIYSWVGEDSPARTLGEIDSR